MKDDTVSRAAAIDAVSRGCQEFRGIFAECEKNLNALPAVQTCDDAVSRADVLETYADLYDVFEDSKAICKELHKVYDRINALPAVQPQPVVRCKDCKWCEDADGSMCKNPASWVVNTDSDFGCVLAERRTK